MDFKALRAKRNDKARSLIESSGGKVDASTWTPDEMLDADVKTGMRPISRRAFKTGGKVEGAEAKTNLSRAPRGFKETVGLANTNQKDANEEREGKKHVGGFKNGGRTGMAGGGMSFKDAFRAARKEMGAGKTFEWNGKSYSTNYAEETEKPAKGLSTPEKITVSPLPEDTAARTMEVLKNTRPAVADTPRPARAAGLATPKVTPTVTARPAGPNNVRPQPRPADLKSPYAIETSPRPKARPSSIKVPYSPPASTSASYDTMGNATGYKKGGMAKKADGGMTSSPRPKARPEGGMTKSPRPMPRPADMAEKYRLAQIVASANRAADREGADLPENMTKKSGGKIAKKKGGMVEGSAKDMREDKMLAKKHGMSMKEWEKSPEDKKHDEGRTKKMGGGSMGMMPPMAPGMKKGGKAMQHEDGTGKACGDAPKKKDGGGLYANIHAKRERGEKMRKAGDKGAPSAQDFKDAAKTADGKEDRMARATGGRAGKGKTNIVINVMPHIAKKPEMGIQPPAAPMPPVGGPPPMEPPQAGPMRLPPGLENAMAGAAGAGPMPPQGGPGPMLPMMGRKSGGKVYPKMHFGSGGGKGRLEKIDEYGKNA